jgi:hypothetical protein
VEDGDAVDLQVLLAHGAAHAPAGAARDDDGGRPRLR